MRKQNIMKFALCSMMIGTITTMPPSVVKADTNDSLYNLDTILNKVVNQIGKNKTDDNTHVYNTYSLDPIQPEIKKMVVEAIGPVANVQQKTLFVDISTLDNTTTEDLTMLTTSFSKKVVNSVTSATTHGFKLAGKASAKVSIPVLGEIGIELSPEYNVSQLVSHTTTEDYTYTVPSQRIKVPKNTTAKVSVHLKQSTITGDVKIETTVAGRVKGYHEYLDKSIPDPTLGVNKYAKVYKDYDYNLNQAFLKEKSLSKEDFPTIKINNDGETIDLIGKGTYEAQYGTEFEVRVKYYDKNGREKRDLATKEEIFTVKPQIVKTR